MENLWYRRWIITFYLSLFVVCFSFARSQNPNLTFKAVNLGGWLVTEGWMLPPSLFEGIPNNDLLDGNQVTFLSTKLNKYLSAENGGGTILVANRPSADKWENFRLWRIDESTFNLRTIHKQFVGLRNEGQGRRIVAISNTNGASETFRIVRNPNDRNRIRIKASNGLFLQVKNETLVVASYEGFSGWGDDDPSVFKMALTKTLQGEFQITNGYGPDRAPQVMRDHWSTYIGEQDFKFMSENGINAVRIPVGWWIARDPMPPKPFVGGSLQALDNAFSWAQTYSIKVIVDLHAVPGSQNGNDHSGTRDGFLEWGDSNIDETVAVIDFLASRYAKNSALAAIELINEPHAPIITFDTLKRYYEAGYNSIRKYTSSAYVILSARLGKADPTEFLSLGRELKRSVLDVHYYSLYDPKFKSMNVQQHIDYINNDRSTQLNALITPDGPLIFVGEWSAAWDVERASIEDYRRFAEAQINVYGRATFGWAYWTYRTYRNMNSNGNNPWSMKWMIKNNAIKL